MWVKLQLQMVTGIRGFNRSWLSCKKKYKNILTEYRNDKHANEISGSDHKQECRWFDEMDTWNNKCTSMYNQIPASAQERNEICSTPPTTPEFFQPNPSTTPSTQEKKKKTQEKIEGLLQQVVGNSTILISIFQ